MPAVAATQVKALFSEGGGELFTVLRINGVTTGDTIDVSTVGATYKKVKSAAFIVGSDLATGATGSVSGTTITLTLASLSNDTIYLEILGSQ